ncbi:hypothetical protein AK812_SmicGene48721, partial [Symbiodinium microadriaticum]
ASPFGACSTVLAVAFADGRTGGSRSRGKLFG